MKKKLMALFLAGAMTLSLAACGGSASSSAAASSEAASSGAASSEAASSAEEPITLRIAYMPNYGSLWSLTTAMNKGYFDEAGITVELTEFQDGPSIIAAMESGSIDMGYIGQGAHKLCIQGNAKIFALSHVSNGDAVIGGPEVKTLEDLKDKTVGVSSGSTSAKSLVKAMIENSVITGDGFNEESFDPATWTEGVSFKQYDDYPSISTALEADEVDAFCVDKSILAVYKTAGRGYIDAEFSPQEYGIATTKGSGFSKLCEDEVSTWLSDGTIDGLIAQYNLG